MIWFLGFDTKIFSKSEMVEFLQRQPVESVSDFGDIDTFIDLKRKFCDKYQKGIVKLLSNSSSALLQNTR